MAGIIHSFASPLGNNAWPLKSLGPAIKTRLIGKGSIRTKGSI
jgi:hypothetical protein